MCLKSGCNITAFFILLSMILLRINEREDNVCLTLKEKSTLENPVYLFEFWSTQNKDTKRYFNATDTSDYPDSYNRFSMKPISTGSPDTSNGEFLALQTDLWNYKVYEMEALGLDPADAIGVVETGIMRVDADRPSVIEFEQETNVITFGQ